MAAGMEMPSAALKIFHQLEILLQALALILLLMVSHQVRMLLLQRIQNTKD